MNNKRGGFGAKLLIILILMIASAIGGAYGYRVLDGKLAVKEATKDITKYVDLDDYDSMEQQDIEDLINEKTKDLETATTRKEVYEIMDDFKKDVKRIKTTAQKKAETKSSQQVDNSQTTDTTQNSTDYGTDSAGDDEKQTGLFSFGSDDDN